MSAKRKQITKEDHLISAISRAYFDDLDDITFPKQKAIIVSKSRIKAIVAGRRSGKTQAAVIALLRKCLSKKRQRCAYVSLTKQHATELIWDRLKHYAADYNLDHEMRFHEDQKEVAFENGSKIMLFGSDTEADYTKLRGNDIDLGIIDEAQSNKFLNDILYSVLLPCTWKVNGEVWVMGSPSLIPRGVWYDIFHGTNTQFDIDGSASNTKSHNEIEKFSWTLKDNVPALLEKFNSYPDALKKKFEKYPSNKRIEKIGSYEILQIVKQMFGGDAENANFRREYLCQWIEDTTKFLYDYSGIRNIYYELPQNLVYILALDIGGDGGNDRGTSDALVVIGFENQGRVVYLVEEQKLKVDIIECAELLKNLHDRYKPIHTIADTGGGGAKAVLTIKNLTNLPVEAVIKTQGAFRKTKQVYIDEFNSFLRRGAIQVPKNALVIQEWTSIKNHFHSKSNSKFMKVEQKENDLSDAFLYAFNKSLPYLASYDADYNKETRIQSNPQIAIWDKREELHDAMRDSIDYGWILNPQSENIIMTRHEKEKWNSNNNE